MAATTRECISMASKAKARQWYYGDSTYSSHRIQVLIDGPKVPLQLANDPTLHAEPCIKGDARFRSIAAASIIAKVLRDRVMVALDSLYPLYGFAQHKGYPTAQHRQAVMKHGPCVEHRRSFQPVKGWIERQEQINQENKKETQTNKGKQHRGGGGGMSAMKTVKLRGEEDGTNPRALRAAKRAATKPQLPKKSTHTVSKQIANTKSINRTKVE
eukprot:GHVS01103696.1.p1 GENE.GHVS01103696.1~~GHVS01103696.1.p1  ORF type:complete len:214 (+),score=27.20 GHVS01103696.1:472-1113(+)